MASKNQRSFKKSEDAPKQVNPHVVVRQDNFAVLKYPALAGKMPTGMSVDHAAMLAGNVEGSPEYIAVQLQVYLDAVSALAAA